MKRLTTAEVYVENKSKGAFSIINMFKFMFIFPTYATKYNFPSLYQQSITTSPIFN